jgi:conserved hypothetical protein
MNGRGMINETTDVASQREANEATQQEEVQAVVATEGFSLWKWLRNPRTLISFGIAIAIVWFAFRGLDVNIQETWQYMKAANIGLYLTGFLMFYLTFPLRAFRWRLLLRNADVPVDAGRGSWSSTPALMEYIFLSWFANCIVPAKLGDAYRGYLLKHNGKVSFSSTIGTIFAERLLDMLALFTLLVISGWVTFHGELPPETRIIFISGLVLVLLIVVGLAGMRWFSPFLRRIVPNRAKRVYISFEEAALRSFRPKVLPGLLLMTVAIWLLEGFRLYFVILSLGHVGLQLGLSMVIFVALASSLLTVLPITPAGLGVVEGTIVAVLVLFNVDTSLGTAVTFLDRTINFWSIIIIGFLVYLFSKRK